MDLIYTKRTAHLASYIARECLLQLYPNNVQIFSHHEMVVSAHRLNEVIILASTLDNNDWMELFLLLDALRGADKIILCLPYVGYARQNHIEENTSCASRMLRDFLESFNNISSCVFLDMHEPWNLKIPSYHISMGEIFARDIAKYQNYVIVSPDFGGVYRAKAVAELLDSVPVVCSKKKDVLGKVKHIDIIGDIVGKNCIIIDDMIDTGATLIKVSDELLRGGAKRVYAYATHCLSTESHIERLIDSSIDEIVVSDSLQNTLPEKFRIISAGSLLSETIRGILP